MVTNQDGLGTESFRRTLSGRHHNKMLQILKDEGVEFSEIFIDRSFPEDNLPTRKPGTAMLTKYLSKGIDADNSYVIGDRLTDVELAGNIGCKAVFFSKKKTEDAVLCTNDWDEICRYLQSKPRTATISRKTSETDINIELNIDGTGKSNISTGKASLITCSTR
jgi:imidazoleglycerol-phosphate dehydratase/histidinol-phosphatase